MNPENYNNIDPSIDELCKSFQELINKGEKKGDILKYIIVKLFKVLWPTINTNAFFEFSDSVHESAKLSYIIYLSRILKMMGKSKRIKDIRCKSKFFNLIKE